MTLYHWEVCLEADYEKTLYIPFDGRYPGTVRNHHSLRVGTERDENYAVQWALDIFPEASVTEIYETNILGDRIRKVK